MPGRKTTVERFDFQRFDAAKVVETAQGFLKLQGNLTRIGVLPYYRADGSVFRELRLPEEVFDAGSLSTMKQAPVTDLHGGMVSPRNVQALQVGLVGEDVDHTDRFVTGSALIQREDAIRKVRARERCELSPGYRCWVEARSGEWHGQKFDGVQRDIVYNHLAIGPKNWGRSGPDVALRIDGVGGDAAFARLDDVHEMGTFLRDRFSLLNMTEGEIARRLGVDLFELGMLLDGFVFPTASQMQTISGLIDVPVEKLNGFIPASEKGESFVNRKRDGGVPPITRGSVPMKKLKIVLDGVEYEVEVPEALAGNLEASLTGLQAKADKVDGLEGELVAAKKATADVQEKLDEATDPTAIQAAIAERTQLVEDAKRIAPELAVDEKLDAKGLRVAALVASGHDAATFADKSDAFVDGMFAGALASAPEAGEHTDDITPPAPRTRTVVAAPTVRTDGTPQPHDKYDSEAARARMVERNRNMSQSNLDAVKKGYEVTTG